MSKKQLERMNETINYQNELIMMMLQTMQHWGILRQNQKGDFQPLFDASRNMPCAWLNTQAHCENKECNWNEDQCVFTGKMDNCEFYEPMISHPKTKEDEKP